MLCCIEQKAASRREKIPPGTKFLVKHDTILQQKEKLRIDTARLVWDNGGNKQNAKGVVTIALTVEQADVPFAFSALPNTALEIENAQHIAELPATGRTSVTVLGAARGVGGIDSWGADVADAYHVSGEGNHSVAFRVLL